jgi:hypothetical protein
MGGQGLRQRLAQGGVREAEMIIRMVQGELLSPAIRALAEGADPSSHGGHMLADGEVDPVTVDGGLAPSTSASKPCVPLLRHTAPQ